jgi:hypothetical protein
MIIKICVEGAYLISDDLCNDISLTVQSLKIHGVEISKKK